jgi:hypothetical protein
MTFASSSSSPSSAKAVSVLEVSILELSIPEFWRVDEIECAEIVISCFVVGAEVGRAELGRVEVGEEEFGSEEFGKFSDGAEFGCGMVSRAVLVGGGFVGIIAFVLRFGLLSRKDEYGVCADETSEETDSDLLVATVGKIKLVLVFPGPCIENLGLDKEEDEPLLSVIWGESVVWCKSGEI